MGDIIQSGPLILGLRERHPHAHLGLLTLKAFEGAARLLPAVDECLTLDQDQAVGLLLDPNHGFELKAAWFLARLRELRGPGWDLVINLTHSRDSAVLASFLSRAETRGIATHPDGHIKVEHDWARYFFCVTGNRAVNHFNLVDMYRRVGGLGPREGSSLALMIPEETRRRVPDLLDGLSCRPLVMIQPGASRENRRWPTERLAEVMESLHQLCGAGFLIVGSAAERALCEELAARVPELPHRMLAGATSLAELGALCEAADLLITNDTGTLHVAAAAGTASVSLFIATALPWETGPWLPGCLVLQVDMECSPCSHHVVCPHVMCREQIPAALVRDAALQILHSGGWAPAPREGWCDQPEAWVWETRRDRLGLQDLRLLGRRPADAAVLTARAYRRMWMESLGETTSGDGHAFRDELAEWLRDWEPAESAAGDLTGLLRDLDRLEDLAGQGLALASRARRELESSTPQATELELVVAELPRVDDQIFTHELSRPLLRPLGVLFRFEKEQLDVWQSLDGLGRATEETYERLLKRCRCLRERVLEALQVLEERRVDEAAA
jgi:ADP-heptose:LPS heptosyltransferase